MMKKDLENLKTLNRQTLIDLIGEDQETRLELHADYIQETKKTIPQLLASVKSADFKAIKDEAHFLKTSSLAIGAERTGNILQNLEYAALDKNQNEILALMNLLGDELVRLNKELVNE